MSVAGAVGVDCTTPQVVSLLAVVYNTKPGFPNVPERKSVSLTKLTAPLKFCDLTFIYSKAAQTVTIQAGALTSLEYITDKFRGKGEIDLSLIEAQPYGPADEALSVQFNLYDTDSTYSVQAIINPVKFNDTVLGIRFDGGPLQPLFYNHRSPSIPFPKSVKSVDVYAKSKFEMSWQRVNLNFQKPKITVYLKAPFPTK